MAKERKVKTKTPKETTVTEDMNKPIDNPDNGAEEAKAEATAAEAEAKKAEKEAKKAEAKAAREAAKEAKKAEKEVKKAEAKAAKEAARMPQQNGIRRPKPGGLCARAWEIFDDVSARNGSPASIKEAMVIAKEQNLNEANVRAEYASWRKFHGITGRVSAPAPVTVEGTTAA